MTISCRTMTTFDLKAGRHEKRAFTLIELLVVISIIALLIAILLPALGQAKARARQIVCMSQLKQIGMAVQYYADDNEMFMPMGKIEFGPQWADNWQPSYAIYVGGDPSHPDWNNLSYFTDNRDAHISGWSLLCPTRPNGFLYPDIWHPPNGDDDSGANTYVGHGAQGDTTPAPFRHSQGPDSPHERLTTIPGKTYLIADGISDYSIVDPSSYPLQEDRNNDGWVDSFAGFGTYFSALEPDRHQGSSNFLFPDGHVKSVSAQSVAEQGQAGGTGMFEMQ